MSDNKDDIIDEVTGSDYKYGFTTDVENDSIGMGLDEDVIRTISSKKKRTRMAFGI